MLSNETKRELGAYSDLFSLVQQFQQAAASSHNACFLVVFALQLQNAFNRKPQSMDLKMQFISWAISLGRLNQLIHSCDKDSMLNITVKAVFLVK